MIKRSAFYKQYKISDAEPVDVIKHRIPISTFTNTVIEFISTEFQGLVEFECKPIWDLNSCIRICEDFTAYFFKNLLAAIYGRETVKIEMEISDDVFFINICSPDGFKIEHNDMTDLLRMAKSSGFSYDLSDNRLSLSVSTFRYAQMSVRSMTQNLLRARFVEIFFTGAPMPDFAL